MIPFNLELSFLIQTYTSGLTLSILIYPLIMQIFIIFNNGNGFKFEYIFPLALILGLIMDSTYVTIYRIFYGKKLWPNKFKEIKKKKWEEFIKVKKSKLSSEEDTTLETYFPIDNSGRYFAECPTKLGNLAYTNEKNYPIMKYNITECHKIYYYLLLAVDKNQIDTLLQKEARAKFIIFSSFSFFIAAVFYLILAIFFNAEKCWVIFNWHPFVPWNFYLAFSILAFIFGFSLYYASLNIHEFYWKLYKSLIDLNIDKIKKHLSKEI